MDLTFPDFVFPKFTLHCPSLDSAIYPSLDFIVLCAEFLFSPGKA